MLLLEGDVVKIRYTITIKGYVTPNILTYSEVERFMVEESDEKLSLRSVEKNTCLIENKTSEQILKFLENKEDIPINSSNSKRISYYWVLRNDEVIKIG